MGCVSETHGCAYWSVNISRGIGSAVGKRRHQSASVVILPTQSYAWINAKVPARRSAKPRRLFFARLFPLPPSPDSPLPSVFCSPASLPTLFSSLPSVTPHLFSPPASLPSATAAHCGQLFNTSPPVSGVLCLIFRSPRRDLEVLPAFK